MRARQRESFRTLVEVACLRWWYLPSADGDKPRLRETLPALLAVQDRDFPLGPTPSLVDTNNMNDHATELAEQTAVTRSVIVVDDHPIIRAGIDALIQAAEDFTLVASVGTTEAAWSAIERFPDALLIVDITLDNDDGITFLAEARAKQPTLEAVVLSGSSSEKHALRAFSAGALGFIEKKRALAELVTALRAVNGGGAYLPRSHAAQVIGHVKAAS